MNIVDNNRMTSATFVTRILTAAENYGKRYELPREISHLESVLRSLWAIMGENAKLAFHCSDPVIDNLFRSEIDQVPPTRFASIDFYIHETWESRADCDPDYIAGDLQDLIRVAWESLGHSEKEKFISSPALKSLLDLYSSLGIAFDD